jgi:hypothetical protein
MRLLCLSFLILLSSEDDHVLAQAITYYSPVDDIVYVQYPLVTDSYFNTMRFRDGGSRVDEAADSGPGLVCMTDNVPGHIYANRHYNSGRREFWLSTDTGETWALIPARPGTCYFQKQGRPGRIPGQATLIGIDYNPWIYCTSNSWNTYDSVRINMQLPGGPPDSVGLFAISYEMGLVYGVDLFDGHTIYVSSDNGQTWARGSFMSYHRTRLEMGARDDLWGCYWPNSEVFVARDTGRTVLDSVLIFHLPEREADWTLHLITTDRPGEAYLLADVDTWTWPVLTEIVIYHILNYGARVDSFYHQLFGYHVDVTRPTPVVRSFYLLAYPNPFNSTTTISLNVPLSARRVTLTTYNLLGQVVREDRLPAAVGQMVYHYDASALASGIYLLRAEAGALSQTAKLVVMK